MKPLIFERIFASPSETVVAKLKSLPGLKNCLYHVKKQENPLYNSFIVAKNSEQEFQEIDKFCGLQFASLIEQVALPEGLTFDNRSLLKYLKLLAEQEITVAAYYKRKVFGDSHVWEIEAVIFDYREDQFHDSVVSEYFDQGTPTFGSYAEITEYSKVSCEVVNGFKGTAKMPPFDVPLLQLLRSYEFYDWHHIAIT